MLFALPPTAGVLEQVLADLDAAHAARIYSAGIQHAFLSWSAIPECPAGCIFNLPTPKLAICRTINLQSAEA